MGINHARDSLIAEIARRQAGLHSLQAALRVLEQSDSADISTRPSFAASTVASYNEAYMARAAQLKADIDAWNPVLVRKDLRAMFTLVVGKFYGLPDEFNLADENVRRVLGNHVRHIEMPGYGDFCRRLKEFQGQGFLYKRLRDKAQGAILTTYPELMSQGEVPCQDAAGSVH